MLTQKKKTKKSVKNEFVEKYVKPIIGLIIIIAIIFIIANIGNKSQGNGSNNQNGEQTSSTNEIGGHIVSQDAAENKCQDAALIGKYLKLSDIKIVTLDYNPQYDPFDGEYDKDKNTIVFIRWNGWDKKAEERLVFTCYVSGSSDEDIKIHYLSVADESGKTANLIGSLYFTTYDKDGNPNL